MEIPLVSFVLISYNQANYIRDALSAALCQDYPNLEILISDDCSSDNTYAIIKEVVDGYNGRHRVTCSRNPTNLGIAGHINKINDITNGELVVIAAGDDISLPHRTQKIVNSYLAHKRTVHYIYSAAIEMSIDGVNLGAANSPGAANANSRIRAGLSGFPIAVGATQAWSRFLIDSFRPLGPQVWAEDQILGFRGMLLGKIVYIDESLVRYRVGSGVSTRYIQFSVKKFFRSRMKDIRILSQRSSDALHVKQFGLSLIIAAKALLLFLTIPISPFIKALRKLVW